MKSLFQDNRLANMLQFFLKTPVITVGTLASKLCVSERTVRNDIKKLNEELRECAMIEGKQGKYSLRIFHSDYFYEKFSQIVETDDFLNSSRNRMDYTFGKLMRQENPLILDDLAYEMNIGRTTLVNDVNKLREELEQFHLSIIGKTSKGLVLQGAETDIRKYVLEKNYDQIYEAYPLDSEIADEISDMFLKCNLQKHVQQSFEKYITLMLDRFLTGHYIGTLAPEYYKLTSKQEFDMVNDLIDKIAHILQVQFPIEEKLFALLPIVGMRTPADIHEISEIQLDEKIESLLQNICFQIQQEMDIRVEVGKFEEEFSYHLMFMLNRLRFGVHLVNPLLDDLKEKYPLAYEMAGVATRVIAKEYGMTVNEDERGYLAAYFGVFLTEKDLQRKRKTQIAVIYEVGIVTARLIAAQLKRIVGTTAQLTLLADNKINSDILNQYDIILTTVKLNIKCDRPVIRIHEIFDEQEIRKKIEKAKYWDQMDNTVLDNNWFVMAGLLEESRFFVLDDVHTYEEAKAYMVGELQKTGQLDNQFLSRLEQREQKGAMIVGRCVAIPHAFQYASDKIVLSIGVTKQCLPCETAQVQKEEQKRQNKDEKKNETGHKKTGKSEKDGQIQVIFLLGIPEQIEDDDRLLIRMYDEIINITQDDALLQKMTKVKSYHDLLRILVK